MFRDTGRWTVVERAPGIAVMEVRGLPSECVADPFWPESVASALCALLDITELEGTVNIRSVDVQTGALSFNGRWKPR